MINGDENGGLKMGQKSGLKYHYPLKNLSLITNFNDQKLLVIIVINLDNNLQNKKNIGYQNSNYYE